MKKIVFYLFIISVVLYGCAGNGIITESKRSGNFDSIKIKSAAIADNKMNESGEKSIFVTLPPQYDISEDRYPVIYYLHGYGGDSYEIFVFENGMYNAMEQGKVAPFIFVAVSGNNSFGGSFYVNSDYSGRWEDNIIKELIPTIDKRYRTLPRSESRGILGFSMGGFGALHIGLKYPESFGAVYALCPGVFVPGKGLVDAMPRWRSMGNFLKAYAAAFSKEQKIPALDGSEGDKSIADEWESGFGNWEPRVAKYLEQKARLKGIRIGFAEYDMFPWITEGSKYLADYMQKQGLPVELQGLPVGHSISPELMVNEILPFFRKKLVIKQM